MSTEIARRILEHFRKGGTLHDPTIEALYRAAHHIGPEVKTDTEAVRRWAYEAAARLDLRSVALSEASYFSARRGK